MDPICVGAGRRCYNGDTFSLPSNHGIQVEVDLLAVQESHIFHRDIGAMVNLNCLQIISKQIMVLAFLHAHQFFPCPLKVPVPLMEKLVTCSNTNHVGLLTLPHALTSSGATIVPSTFTTPH